MFVRVFNLIHKTDCSTHIDVIKLKSTTAVTLYCARARDVSEESYNTSLGMKGFACVRLADRSYVSTRIDQFKKLVFLHIVVACNI